LLLSELIDDEGDPLAQSKAVQKVEITGLTADSRKVQPGNLFAALPSAGNHENGRSYISDALSRGAAAILAPTGTALEISDLPNLGNIPIVEDAEPRRRLSIMAARFFSEQPDTICAVTGTNGKTSVASFVRQIWAHMNLPGASMGTLGISAPEIEEPGTLTTPDPVTLHDTLMRLTIRGVSHLALEASSHGLDQFRLDGVRLQAAAFTNITRDHLDYHGTDQDYFMAKARLFSDLLPEGGIAVLNADIPEFERLCDIATNRGIRIISYGIAGTDIKIMRHRPQGLGQLVSLDINGTTQDINVPLVGGFQIQNVACALGLVMACGGETSAALGAIPHLVGAPGRMELIGSRKNGGAAFVDYAHTPDALANALSALRPHATGRLSIVFGCGGDRDRGKRPEMGLIAAQSADRVIVTDDNPRNENADTIRRDILAGVPDQTDIRVIANRHDAIQTAISELGAGDILVVAGKGHERGQIIGDQVLPFFDADEITQAISREDAPK
jgi:UDP-N-acetylmuramoyl-L-alanyl-D-glutamate--2,6-diaminopimelate ligase